MRRGIDYEKGSILFNLGLFTLIVILLVLLAIPGINRVRIEDQRRICFENQVRLLTAKEHYALDHNLRSGATLEMNTLIRDGKALKTEPVCPSGGKYSLKPLGQSPTCSHPGHGIIQAKKISSTNP